MMTKLAAAGVAHDVEIVDDFNKSARRAFLQSLNVLSAPAPDGEAFGLFILEAGACGVPVVQPDAGAFREVVEMTGGGIVYDPGRPAALVESLRDLLVNPERCRELGRQARAAVSEQFSSDAMARNMEAVFADVTAGASMATKDRR